MKKIHNFEKLCVDIEQLYIAYVINSLNEHLPKNHQYYTSQLDNIVFALGYAYIDSISFLFHNEMRFSFFVWVFC